MRQRTVPGLKQMRKLKGKEPTYKCDNCKCARYSPCGCTKTNEGSDE